jgi:hypothetical protein
MVSKLALWMLAGSALLGGYMWVGTVWWPGYLEAMRLHLVLGLGVLLLSIPALAWHVNASGSPLVVSLLVPAAALVGLGLVCPQRPEFPAFGPVGYAGISTGIQLALTALVARVIRKPEPRKPGVWGGLLLAVGCIYLLHAGLAGLLLRGDERWGAMMAHSACGVAALILLPAHLTWLRERLRWALPPLVAVLLVGAGWFWFQTYPHDLILQDFRSPTGYDQKVEPIDYLRPGDLASTVPDTLEELLDPNRPKLDPEVMGNSARCGESGCHEILTEQWEGSLHRMAVDNNHFEGVLALMISEKGPESAVFCVSCHDPVASLAGTVVQDYASGDPPPSDGVSCAVCHGTIQVPDDPHNANMLVRQPRVYPGRTVARRNALISLDPRAHRQDYAANYRMNEGHLSCAPCHRMRIGPEMGASLVATVPLPYVPPDGEHRATGLGCNDCHMPTLTIKRSWEQGLYDHFWTGTGWDLPLYANHPEADAEALEKAAKHALDFVGGELDVSAFGRTELGYEIPAGTVAEMKTVGLLHMSIDASQQGGTLQIDVTSTKHRGGHPFPTGSLDIKDFWQELRVLDSSGTVLSHHGWLDEAFQVDPNAHRLGATYYDENDRPMYRHRVWTLSAVRGIRQIQPGGSVADRYEIEIPPEATSPLTIEVAWRYRRINQVFTDFVYGGGRTFPIHEIESASIQVPWEGSPAHAPEAEGEAP